MKPHNHQQTIGTTSSHSNRPSSTFQSPLNNQNNQIQLLQLNREDRPSQNEVSSQLQTNRTMGIQDFQLPQKQAIIQKSNNIKSYLRLKPNKNVSFLPIDIYNNQTIVCDRSVYKFDFIFDQSTEQVRYYLTQKKIYQIVGKDVTEKFIEGYNGTIFAYGSTGSGKTYTMFGNSNGLVPSVVDQIFSKLHSSHKLSCSMLQIYK